MMYAGLRMGEACAITSKDIAGDKLTVAQQVVELMKTGHPTIVRLGTGEDGRGDCRRSWWLSSTSQHLTGQRSRLWFGKA